MKKYLLILSLLMTMPLWSRVSADRIKGWLELDDIQKNAQALMNKYELLDNELKKDANEFLQQGIDEADELATSDPYAALIMYHNIKNVKNISIEKSQEIVANKKRFQELSDYVDLQYKELRQIRLKHLRFPY
ncbi:MAG: hypothetical protein Q8Q60_01680 [Candidatus Chromulinivorax sp.]|nr:hypothetical protein [Candidatus Chromulinivorax sp.]